jgi:hypothetical protein
MKIRLRNSSVPSLEVRRREIKMLLLPLREEVAGEEEEEGRRDYRQRISRSVSGFRRS